MISIPYLNESLLCEVTIGSKKCIIGTVYRSPSKNSDEFESFLSDFEFLLQDITNCSPYLTLLLGDYNLLALITLALNGVIFCDMTLKGRRYLFVYESLTVNI